MVDFKLCEKMSVSQDLNYANLSLSFYANS